MNVKRVLTTDLRFRPEERKEKKEGKKVMVYQTFLRSETVYGKGSEFNWKRFAESVRSLRIIREFWVEVRNGRSH